MSQGGNIHSFLTTPFKKSSKLNYSKPLNKFIDQAFGPQAVDLHRSAIDSLNRMREDVRTVEDRSEGNVAQHLKHYNLFKSLSTRIPFTETDVRAQFVWSGAFSRKTIKAYDSTLELAGCLFNIGTIYGGIGVSTENLKEGCKAFQSAAGAFQAMRDLCQSRSHGQFSMDLGSDSTDMLINLMLAQAQECYYLVAEQGGKSQKVCALLAWKAHEFYSLCTVNMVNNKQLLKVLPKGWASTISFKVDLMEARAGYHSSDALYKSKQYGVCLARLGRSLHLLQQKNLAHCSALFSMVSERFTKTQRENDTIYFKEVPPLSAVDPEPRKAMVKAVDVPSMEADDPFRGLVPVAIHQQAERYNEQKNSMVAAEGSFVEQANQTMRDALHSMGLPGALDAADNSQAIPQGVREGIQRVMQGGGWARIRELIVAKTELAAEDKNLLNEAKRALDEEEREDAAGRTTHGTLWQRTPSHSLTNDMRLQIAKYETNLQQAAKSDALVEGKINAVGSDLEAMSSGGVERMLPASTATRTDDPRIPQLRQCLVALDAISRERQQLYHQLRERVATDDITNDLMQAGDTVNEEAFFKARLEQYQGVISLLRENSNKQMQQLEITGKLNNEFQQAKSNTAAETQRQAVLQRLSTASHVFTEVSQNLTEGITFYSNLQEMLGKLKRRVQDWCFARKSEKAELEQMLNNTKASSQMQPGNFGQQPHHQQYPTQSHYYGTQQQQQQQQQQAPPTYQHNYGAVVHPANQGGTAPAYNATAPPASGYGQPQYAPPPQSGYTYGASAPPPQYNPGYAPPGNQYNPPGGYK